MSANWGRKLFERTHTCSGIDRRRPAAAAYAEKVVTELRQLGVAQGSTLASRSTLTIAATPVIATCLLPKVVAEFARKRIPRCESRSWMAASIPFGQAVLEGHANMGMAFFVNLRLASRESVCRFRLMSISPGERRPGYICPKPNMEISGWPTHDCFADVKPDSGLD